MSPEKLRYSRDHVWVRLEGGQAVVGITDHAQETLGDITYVELPALGEQLTQGGELGVIESVKAASAVLSPLTGTVAGLNAELAESPELINRDPYGRGWICRLKDCDEAGLAGLMDAAQYAGLLNDDRAG
ncbi:MAG: glycine cleavage system protein GcvH [bacterium]